MEFRSFNSKFHLSTSKFPIRSSKLGEGGGTHLTVTVLKTKDISFLGNNSKVLLSVRLLSYGTSYWVFQKMFKHLINYSTKAFCLMFKISFASIKHQESSALVLYLKKTQI